MQTVTIPNRVAIIGAGTMGRAIAAGMVRAHVVEAHQLTISDRDPAQAAALATSLPGATASADNAAACAHADIVLLCVKPNDVTQASADLAGVAPGSLLISIAAGVSIATLEQAAGGHVAVVRAMPNTPCLIGQGLTVLSAGHGVSDAQLASAHRIFSALGRCMTLAEKHLDAVTAVSASGPAFIYVMIEALAAGGVSCGLPRDIATEMASHTALGAAAMVLATGKHPAMLRDDVTSPGGCTIAGLLALEDGGFRSVVSRAVQVTATAAAGLGR
jgi:pyrroline-5-carboxylate reductase